MLTLQEKINVPVRRLSWYAIRKIAVIAVCRGVTWNDVACEMLADYTLEELV